MRLETTLKAIFWVVIVFMFLQVYVDYKIMEQHKKIDSLVEYHIEHDR